MNKKITYTSNGSLEKQIKSKKIIPYLLYPNERYKLNKWYYSFYYNSIFKITEVEYTERGELDYALTKTDDGNFNHISTELDFLEDYAIYYDRRKICDMNIINNPESFTGAEIVYWFFVHDIDCFNLKYQGFWKYIDRYSKYRIADRDRYFIKAKILNDNYVDCSMIKDISYISHNQKVIQRAHGNSDNLYMKKLKEKDMRRMSEIHKNDFLEE